MASGNEVVTVVRTTKVDKLSTPAAGPPDEFDLVNCQVLPRRALEEGRGWVSIDGWEVWCFTDPAREVLHTDQVRIRGVLYSVEGKPARFDKRGKFKALSIVAAKAST